MQITKSKLKKIILEEIQNLLQEDIPDYAGEHTVPTVSPNAFRKWLTNMIYDMTASKDVPSTGRGPKSNLKGMMKRGSQPWEYEEKTEDEREKYEAAIAIAALLGIRLLPLPHVPAEPEKPRRPRPGDEVPEWAKETKIPDPLRPLERSEQDRRRRRAKEELQRPPRKPDRGIRRLTPEEEMQRKLDKLGWRVVKEELQNVLNEYYAHH